MQTAPATAGFYRDGRVAEVFISGERSGSAIEALGQDASVAVSLALQCGCPIEVIRHALLKDADGSAATAIGAALEILVGAS